MKNSKIYIQYLGACRFRDKICFPNREFNRIFSIDVKNFVLNFEQNISFLKNQEEYPYYGNLHCIYNDRIFFFPYNCSYVMVYDLQTNDTKGIFIKTADGLNTYWTAGIFQCKEKVIIFPSKMIQGIFVLDLKTLQIVRDIELEKALYDVEFIYNYDNVIKLNETEVVFLSGRHTIIGFDIQNKKKIFSRRFEGLDIWGMLNLAGGKLEVVRFPFFIVAIGFGVRSEGIKRSRRNIDFPHTQRDTAAEHFGGDACAAVEHQRCFDGVVNLL